MATSNNNNKKRNGNAQATSLPPPPQRKRRRKVSDNVERECERQNPTKGRLLNNEQLIEILQWRVVNLESDNQQLKTTIEKLQGLLRACKQDMATTSAGADKRSPRATLLKPRPIPHEIVDVDVDVEDDKETNAKPLSAEETTQLLHKENEQRRRTVAKSWELRLKESTKKIVKNVVDHFGNVNHITENALDESQNLIDNRRENINGPQNSSGQHVNHKDEETGKRIEDDRCGFQKQTESTGDQRRKGASNSKNPLNEVARHGTDDRCRRLLQAADHAPNLIAPKVGGILKDLSHLNGQGRKH